MRSVSAVLVLLTAAAALASCGQDTPRGDPLKGGEAPPPAGMPPGMGNQLPEGHPPVMPPGHPPMGDTPKMANPEKLVAYDWAAPAGWRETPPANAMRVAQFELPQKWPDGVPVTCVVTGNIAGGRQANIDRWVGQFTQKDGSDSKSKLKTSEKKAGDVTVTRVEITGAFSDGMQKPPRSGDDCMLLGGIVEGPDGSTLFVKLSGPRAAIEAEAGKFDELLASFRRR